jgi:GntR family transcriptional regulator
MLQDRTAQNAQLWTRPLYLQLRDALVERIARGEWKPGMTIPNESDLAREFGVSAGTMRKALDLMEGERLLTRRQGRGTFVNDQGSEELALRYCNIRGLDGRRITGEVASEEIMESAASEAECARLRLRPQDRVFRLRRMLVHKKQPFMVEEAAVPADLFPGLAEKHGRANPLIALCQQFGVLLGKAEERLSIALATKDLVDALGVAPASPVMVLDRVVHNLDGRPVEWRIGRCALADRYYMAEMA